MYVYGYMDERWRAQNGSREEQKQRIGKEKRTGARTHIVMTQNVVAASWALRPGTSPRHATHTPDRVIIQRGVRSGSPRHPQFQRLGPVECRQIDSRVLLVDMGKYMIKVTSASFGVACSGPFDSRISMVVGLTEKLIAIDMPR